jgi:Fe-S oxidoreductase
VFSESYYLDIEILHHTQFIKILVDDGMLNLNFSRKRVVYHSPCELGRRSGIYDEPKEILKHVALLEETMYEDENSLCCGGSLANLKIDSSKKKKIATDAASVLTSGNPDILATACPLCKKTFSAATSTKVSDIAEIVAASISPVNLRKPHVLKQSMLKELAGL